MVDKTKYYPFLPKGSSLESYKTVSSSDFSAIDYGEEMSGSYSLSSSITAEYFYQNSGFISEKRKIYALKNTLNSYTFLSPYYAYSSSLGNKANQSLKLISIPSIFYGSSIEKGSVELNYYVSGTLVGTLKDVNKNGELIQTHANYYDEHMGSVAGVVLYNEGFILLTGDWAISVDDSHIDAVVYNPTTSFDVPRWIYWGAGLGVTNNVTKYSSFDIKFNGINYINTITMFAHADKGELNHSNNPTYLKHGSEQTTNSSSISYVEGKFTEIKNTVKYPYENYSGSLEKHTYISKVALYDENKNLIGIAKLAKPIKKTENRDFTFKIKVDI